MISATEGEVVVDALGLLELEPLNSIDWLKTFLPRAFVVECFP
jgi:hypothetical protein